MFFSFGKRADGYDNDSDEFEPYDEDGFYMDYTNDMFGSNFTNSFTSYSKYGIKSKIKEIKEKPKKNQNK